MLDFELVKPNEGASGNGTSGQQRRKRSCRSRRNTEAGTFNARLTIASENDRECVQQPNLEFINMLRVPRQRLRGSERSSGFLRDDHEFS